MDVRLPDGTVVNGIPDGMSQADLVAKLKANGHDTSWYQASQQAAAPEEKPSNPLLPVQAVASGVNRGALTMLPGLAGDTAANLIDLTRAGYGTAKRVIGGQGTEMPDLLDRSKLPLTSAWLQSQLDKSKFGREMTRTGAEEYPGLHAGGTALGASLAPGTTPRGMAAAGTSGLVGQKVGEVTDSPAAAMLAAVATPVAFGAGRTANTKPLNTRERTLQAGQDEGMVVAPAEMGKGFLQGVGGKARVQQTISERNQQVVNKLSAEFLGLPPETEVTQPILEQIRSDAGQAYAAVKKQGGQIQPDLPYLQELLDASKSADRIKLDFPNAKLPAQDKIGELVNGAYTKNGFTAEGAIEYVKRLRADARSNISSHERLPDPDKLALGKAQQATADALDGLIERNLTAQGKPELMQAYKDARVQIAKTYTVENALNPSTANVSARKLSKAPFVTGPLKTAADFAAAFPKSNQSPEMIGGIPSVSQFDIHGGIIAGSVAAGAGGLPAGLLAGGVPMLRSLAVPMAMSKGYQRSLLGRQAPRELGPLPLTMPGLLAGQQQEY